MKWFGSVSGEQFHFEVDGFRCTQCEATIKIALRNLPGVKNVKIQNKKTVLVERSPDAVVTREELKAAINQTGYRVVGED